MSMGREEPVIGVSALEQEAMDGERHGDVGAWPHREVQVGLPRQRRRAGIDDDHGGARASRACLMNGIR